MSLLDAILAGVRKVYSDGTLLAYREGINFSGSGVSVDLSESSVDVTIEGAALTSSAPSSVGTSNTVGVAADAARADHVHNHGAQTDESLHAVATTSLAGFMSAADKTALDGAAALNEVNTESTTARTVSATDDLNTTRCTNASGCAVTIPTDLTDDLRIGFRAIYVGTQDQVTFSWSDLTIVRASTFNAVTAEAGSPGYIEKLAANTWLIAGDLELA